MTVTIPMGILRDVFARPHPDALLHLLSGAEDAILYADARDALGIHPQEFQRALDALEKWGVVQLRAVPKNERPDNRRRVRLELTALGTAVARLHDDMDESWRRIADGQGIARDALAVA